MARPPAEAGRGARSRCSLAAPRRNLPSPPSILGFRSPELGNHELLSFERFAVAVLENEHAEGGGVPEEKSGRRKEAHTGSRVWGRGVAPQWVVPRSGNEASPLHVELPSAFFTGRGRCCVRSVHTLGWKSLKKY